MDIAMESGLSVLDLCTINRCHVTHKALFLSDMTTRWGGWSSSQFTSPPQPCTLSSLRWPPEHPTKSDWSTCLTSFSTPLLPPIHLIHHLAPWHHPSDRKDVSFYTLSIYSQSRSILGDFSWGCLPLLWHSHLTMMRYDN